MNCIVQLQLQAAMSIKVFIVAHYKTGDKDSLFMILQTNFNNYVLSSIGCVSLLAQFAILSSSVENGEKIKP